MAEGSINAPSSAPSRSVSKAANKSGEGLNKISESISADLEKLEVVSETVAENNERPSEQSSGGSTGDQSGQTQAQQMQARRQQLINSKPTKSKMVSDIRKTVSSELRRLEIKEARAKRNAVEAAKELNEVVAQIRGMRKILSGLAHATYDQLKKLWLKVVHGIV